MMRNYLLLALLLLLTCNPTQLFCQLLELPGKGTNTLKQTSVKELDTDMVYSLPIKLSSKPIGTTVTVSDANAQTADKDKDYVYIGDLPSFTISATTADYFFINIKVPSRKMKTENRSFQLDFSYTWNNNPTQQHLQVTIESFVADQDKKAVPDTSKWKMRLITGSNFDFFDAPAFKNFAGDLSLFLPELIALPKKDKPGKYTKIGMSAGFFNFRYFDADSSNGRIRTDKYLLDARVRNPIVDSTQYVNETYALNSSTSFNTVGAYLNPIISLYQNKWTELFFQLHIEGLWRTQITTDRKVPMRKDTATWSTTDLRQNIVLQSNPGLRPTYNRKTFNDLYVGIGFPIRVNIANKFDFFVASTAGLTSYDGLTTQDSVARNVYYRTFVQERTTKGFWLTKVQLVTTVAPIDIAAGGEFRQIFDQRAFYSVYLGATLSLDKLKK